MYFEDLSPYAYDVPRVIKAVLNVGWLDSSYSFPTGNPPTGFLENLKMWSVQAGANQMRGFHRCRFCITRPDRISYTFNDQVRWLGSREVWIPGEQGKIYACPDLVVHYVQEHLYLPPEEFIEAVMKPIPLNWNADAVAEVMTMEAYTGKGT